MNRHIPALLLSLASLGLPAAAEPVGPGVRALLLAPEGAVSTLYPVSGETRGKGVVVGARGLSEPFHPPAREFSLMIEDNKRESGFRDAGKAALPPEGDDFIILLEPEHAAFKVHVIHGGDARFGPNGILFFNASESNIGIALGASKLLVKPRAPVFAKPPDGGGRPYYQVTFFEAENGKARPFVNTRWPHRENSRCYVFLYRNRNGRFTYQAVDEAVAGKGGP